jgi:microcystin-dependent protein
MLVTNNTNQDYWVGPLVIPAGVVNMTIDDTSATSLYLTDDAVADAINSLAASGQISVSNPNQPFPRPTGEPEVLHGDGNPEGLIYAGRGSLYLRRDVASGYLKTTGIHLNTGWAVFTVTPTGTITMYGAASAPAGWLLCDGSPVSRTTYASLFALIGIAYGAGDGSTTFNVPDLRGRVPAGFAASGGHADVSSLGNADTTTLANRRPKHTHTLTDPGHSHKGFVSSPNGAAGSSTYGWATPGGNPTTVNATGITIGNAPGFDPVDAPGYLVVNYIIKT